MAKKTKTKTFHSQRAEIGELEENLRILKVERQRWERANDATRAMKRIEQLTQDIEQIRQDLAAAPERIEALSRSVKACSKRIAQLRNVREIEQYRRLLETRAAIRATLTPEERAALGERV
jgi:polyhydroxyalkanoate synthesis regulator phasin